jgi:hypothetical protein
MAQPRILPANYPQPLGNHVLRADVHRQMSILRQEIVTELLSVLGEAREPAVRSRLVKLIESQLRTGRAALEKAENLWPTLAEAKEAVQSTETKPATQKRHLKLFEHFDRVQRRSWALLHDSFDNVRLIVDRVQPAERVEKGVSGAGK